LASNVSLRLGDYASCQGSCQPIYADWFLKNQKHNVSLRLDWVMQAAKAAA
jgi:hypothetical protein